MLGYDQGDLVRLTSTFTDLTGQPVDPNSVQIVVQKPDGTESTHIGPEVVHDATGTYHFDLTPDQTGVWNYRWESFGPGQAAEPGQFRVRPRYFGAAVPTPGDVAALVRTRLRDDVNRLQETFTATTSPTLEQVKDLIANEAGLVTIRCGKLDNLECPDREAVWSASRQIIAKRVAAIIEASYRPEQISQGMTVEDFYQGQIDADVQALVTASRECRAHGTDEDDLAPPPPSGVFPPAVPLRW
jgi:hypothetical protein